MAQPSAPLTPCLPHPPFPSRPHPLPHSVLFPARPSPSPLTSTTPPTHTEALQPYQVVCPQYLSWLRNPRMLQYSPDHLQAQLGGLVLASVPQYFQEPQQLGQLFTGAPSLVGQSPEVVQVRECLCGEALAGGTLVLSLGQEGAECVVAADRTAWWWCCVKSARVSRCEDQDGGKGSRQQQLGV